MSASSQLVVGEVAGDMAVLTDASSLIVCRLPLALLPPGVEAGAYPRLPLNMYCCDFFVQLTFFPLLFARRPRD